MKKINFKKIIKCIAIISIVFGFAFSVFFSCANNKIIELEECWKTNFNKILIPPIDLNFDNKIGKETKQSETVDEDFQNIINSIYETETSSQFNFQ